MKTSSNEGDRMDDRVLFAIREHNLVISAEIREQRLLITAKNGNTILPAILAIFERYSVTMNAISIRSPSLEDVFIYLTGKKLSDYAPGNDAEQKENGRGYGR
jgi:ABC-2 type transport system ATP-binding protein